MTDRDDQPPVPQQGPGQAEAQPGVVIPGSNWTLFRKLPKFDLRNGDPSDVTSIFLKATISEHFHWVPVDGIAPEHASEVIDGYIKSHLAYLAETKPAAMTNDQARKVAICLGTARAVSTAFYRLQPGDLIPGETAPAIITAARTDAGAITYRKINGAVPNPLLDQEMVFTDTEKAAICALVKCCVGIIPMQGYSLVMTNHHYLSQNDSQSRKVFSVAEKAYWKSPDVEAWFAQDTQMIQDALWHKACHPVMMNIKTDAAMNPEISQMLILAGSGACASRLPAVETELRAANSYLTLMSTVSPMFQICEGSIDFGALSEVVEIVKSLPPGVAEPEHRYQLTPEMKEVMKNRSKALDYLGRMLKRNQDTVAYCYGFYVALSESTMMTGAGTGTDTLKTSYSLTKLKTQSFAAYTSGFQAYGDYQAVRNAMRAKGEHVAPKFVVE